MQFTLSQIFTLLGALQGLIVAALFLFSPFFKSKANNYLALTLGIIALMGILFVMDASASPSPFVIFLNDIMWELLFPVGLFRYFAQLLAQKQYQSPNYRWLYLPFAITLLVNLIVDLSHEFKLYEIGFPIQHPWLQAYYNLEEAGSILFALAILIFLYRLTDRADVDEKSRKWAREFWWLFVIGVVFWGVIWLVFELTEQDYLLILWSTITIILFTITYRGVLQFRLAEQRFEIRERMLTQPQKIIATSKVEIAKNQADVVPQEEGESHYLAELERLMEEEYLYRQPTLSRDEVAERLGISSGYLSRKLSVHPSGGFADYVNSFRIKEVQRFLLDPEFRSYSLLAIGYEAGFNSKSAFYSAFRKYTGLTPSAYRKRAMDLENRKRVS